MLLFPDEYVFLVLFPDEYVLALRVVLFVLYDGVLDACLLEEAEEALRVVDTFELLRVDTPDVE